MKTPLQVLKANLKSLELSRGAYEDLPMINAQFDRLWKRDTAMILKYKRAIEKLLK